VRHPPSFYPPGFPVYKVKPPRRGTPIPVGKTVAKKPYNPLYSPWTGVRSPQAPPIQKLLAPRTKPGRRQAPAQANSPRATWVV